MRLALKQGPGDIISTLHHSKPLKLGALKLMNDLDKHQIRIWALIESLERYADETTEILLDPNLLDTLERAIESIRTPSGS